MRWLLITEEENDESLGLDEAYSVKSPEDNKRLYAKWAATYESGFVDKEKYRYPKAVAELFSQVCNGFDIKCVVDVGTGTGLTGTYLSAQLSEVLIDGIDISPEMLEQARKKTRTDGRFVYSRLYERDLSQPLDIANSEYGALICSGTFTHGHLGPEAFDNLIPLVRAGGLFVIGVNNEHFIAKNFHLKLHDLEASALISRLEVHLIDCYEPGSAHFGDQARVLVFVRS